MAESFRKELESERFELIGILQRHISDFHPDKKPHDDCSICLSSRIALESISQELEEEIANIAYNN